MNQQWIRDRVFTALETDRSTGYESLELLTGWAMLEAALWTLGKEQILLGVAAIIVMGAFNYVAGCTAWEQGFNVRANRQALWMAPLALGVAGAMIAIGSVAGTLHAMNSFRTPLAHSIGYATWAFVQEWMALGFVLVRLERLMRPAYAVIGCAVMFSMAHLPNPMLMAATFVMSCVFAAIFRRYRALYPLAFAHALFGLSLALATPGRATHFMRVGAAYFR